MADDTNTPSEENLKLAADLKLLKEYKDLTAAAAADWKKISEIAGDGGGTKEA